MFQVLIHCVLKSQVTPPIFFKCLSFLVPYIINLTADYEPLNIVNDGDNTTRHIHEHNWITEIADIIPVCALLKPIFFVLKQLLKKYILQIKKK